MLRLAGHDEQSVWGEFFYHREDRAEAFRFDMHHWVLTRTTADGEVIEQLDEMGLLKE